MKLLIVIDDWEALDIYQDRLTPHFELTCAPFASEGIRMAREQRPERMLLDLTQDDMRPDEACALLRAQPETREIPLTVILNAGVVLPRMEGVFPIPGDHVIHRPFDFAKLREKLG